MQKKGAEAPLKIMEKHDYLGSISMSLTSSTVI